MEKLYIKFEVRGQEIKRVDSYQLYSKSRNFVCAKFLFDKHWANVTRFASIANSETTYTVEIVNGECLVPWECLAEAGTFTVSVFGGDLITANKVTVTVLESGLAEGELPDEPTPGYFQQIVDEVKASETNAKNSEDNAENYKDLAETAKNEARKWVDGTGAISSDEQYENNAKYYAEAAGAALAGKADKVTNPTLDNFVSLDANGNLKDSGKKATDFEEADAVTLQKAKEYTDVVKDRVETIITTPVEGVSAQEIIDARAGEASLGAKIGKVESAIATNKAEVATQLADKANLIRNDRTMLINTSRSMTTNKHIISIVDDDGYSALATVLMPWCQANGIPVGAAIGGNSQVLLNAEHRNYLLQMQNAGLFEALSHTMNHVEISNLTPAQYNQDCIQHTALLNEYGFNINGIAYPYGDMGTTEHYDVTAKHYLFGLGTGAVANTLSRNPYSMGRIGIGSYMSAEYDTLSKIQDMLDDAYDNYKYPIFMTHCAEGDTQIIFDAIQYALNKGFEFVLPSDGMRYYGPIVSSGDFSGPNYTAIYPSGLIRTGRYSLTNRITGRAEDDPPEITHPSKMNTFSVDESWSAGKGVVYEYIASNGYQLQLYIPAITNGNMLFRRWIGSKWHPWYDIAGSPVMHEYSQASTTVSAHSTLDLTIYNSLFLKRCYYIAQPNTQPEIGIIWNIWSHGDGAVKLRIANITDEDITIAANVWKITGYTSHEKSN